MKKMFKNHDLFKVVGLAILLSLLLTWIIPSGAFSGTEFTDNGIRRIGLFDFFLTGVYSVNYFILQITMLLVVGGFYGVLNKVQAYQTLVQKLAKSIKGKEIAFVLVTSFIFALLASISTEIWHLVIFIPFIISIILNAKMDKITAFCATFGGILVGLLGVTYSGIGLKYLNDYLGTNFDTLFYVKIIVFFITYLLFNFFTLTHIKKTVTKEDKKELEIIDPYAGIEPIKKKNAKIYPIVIVLAIVAILQIIGYIGWSSAFELNWAADLHKAITEFKIGEDFTIFKYILGSFNALGSWDLFSIQVILLLALIPIALIGKVSFDEVLESFANGVKKFAKPILFVLLINAFFIFTYWSPIVPTIVNRLIGLTSGFNVYLTSLIGIISSYFHVDFAYGSYAIGSFFAGTYPDFKDVIMLVLTSTHGLVQFIAPSSALLFVGLSYLDISYKSWFKHIWKFLVGMIICLLIVFTLLVYM